jgi:integrase
MGFCYKNGYHTDDLSADTPSVYYEKRSRIPSAYSYDDVMKLLSLVDRNNPVGKRNYAVLMLLTRLGIRCGDICRLQYENIDWERNIISFTQHKTGKPLTLPLLEDVGLAIIDYLKFGRPECDSANIFIRHRAPIAPFIAKSFYTMISSYIGKAGLHTQGKKRGPHALRHSLASRLLEENVPLPVISEILGHANTNTTAAYLSISIDKLRNCALEV